MRDEWTRQVLAFPFLPSLSEVSRLDTLYRHASYAEERGFHDVAQEYLNEARRREAEALEAA